MQSNYSTETMRGAAAVAARGGEPNRKKKKELEELLTSGQKTDWENLRVYPFRPSRRRKEGAFNFQARFMMAVREN